jgi:hypothetical protein
MIKIVSALQQTAYFITLGQFVWRRYCFQLQSHCNFGIEIIKNNFWVGGTCSYFLEYIIFEII